VSGGVVPPTTPTTPVNMTVSSSTPQFCVLKPGTAATKKKPAVPADPCGTKTSFSASMCFDNNQSYTVSYYQGSSLGTFNGLNLNWYFSNGAFTTGSIVAIATTTSQSRMTVAKSASLGLLSSLTPATGENVTVRLGLTTYNNGDGGKLVVPIDDLKSDTSSTTDQVDLIKNGINGLGTSGVTPLATTLSDIGRYFALGQTGNLTLHPGVTNTSKTIQSIFNNHCLKWGSSNNTTQCDTSPPPAPIQSFCQKSAVILVSDGLPNGDRSISTSLTDYTGDCAVGKICDATIDTSINFPGPTVPTTGPTTGPTSCNPTVNNNVITTPGTATCKNGSKTGRAYETDGSDYLDDVAVALYDMDLRPSWSGITKPTGSKNNIKTYAIGIADPALQGDSVLRDSAIRAGGSFEYADNASKLIAALDKMVADIQQGVGSFSAIAANSSQLGAGSALFQAKYDTTDWTGDFIALPLTPSEDTNGNGKLDTGEDTNTNGVLDTGGGVQNAAWNAGERIPAYLSRNIYTYNSSASPKGIKFQSATAVAICGTLTTTQKTALGIASCVSTDPGVWLLDYLRGDMSHEKVNTVNTSAYTVANPDPRTGNTNQVFRNRARFWDSNAIAPIKEGDLRKPDPWLLGDIVNSDPVYVSNENYGYDTLSGTKAAEGASYKAFLTTNNSRLKMAYVGANDGMLHGFNASISTADISSGVAGKEVLAYMPNTIFDKLPSLSSLSYSHLYYVDGSPSVGDVYFDGTWHTVLVGTTGAGGKGIFALDITNPSTFDGTKVLWEIGVTASNVDGPVASDLTTDTTALRGFKNNLGFTLPQAAIGKMHDGSWAAIVANGYASGNNLGVLYIINIKTGAIIAAIDTKVSSAGASAPFLADVDFDGIIDAVYAGDLLGNMWKFDVSASTASQWKIAYSSGGAPAPLFTACNDVANCDTTRQAITNKPQVGSVGSTQKTGGVMVYFGTGKYFEDTDNLVANTQTQSFYGVWDKCPLASSGSTAACSTVAKTSLVQQTIDAQLAPSVDVPIDVRVTSQNPVDYTTTNNGWFMDFVNPNTSENEGERIVSASLLRGGRIIFATLIPVPPKVSNDPNALCTAGSKSTSWLTELDAISGGRLSSPALDINGSRSVTSTDTVTVTVNGKSITVPASGIKMTNGSTKTPAVMTNPGSDEIKYTGSSEGTAPSGIIESPIKNSDKGAGRQSWRQL
jgi:type IV pilus assembly protein PilY1